MSGYAKGSGRVPTGFAAETFISESTFRQAHRAVEANPNAENTKKRKRENKGDSSIVSGAGAYKGPWARYEEERPDAASDDEFGDDEEVEIIYEEDEIEGNPAPPPKKLAGTDYHDTEAEGETSEFVGSQEYDYQGRSYMHVPNDLDIKLSGDRGEQKNFIPKKLIHTYKYHTKSITQVRFMPDSGHLLLSASADSKIALWDVYHQRELLRTYSGHTKSVNDIDFNASGTQFISASYDRYMKLWDTETGKCLNKFTTGKTPHVVRMNPSIPHEFLAGMSDKKILQYDTRSGEMVQEYDHHLGPVNTITFCDEDRRFVTTSDDKSLRAWEYGIPVPIKFIAEPYMFAMVRSAPHPSGKYIAFQSSDNQITVYSSADKFRQNRKKSYRGHNVAGYAPDVAISPDGQIVSSGDSGGYVCFWDWKTCKMWHKIQASDTAVLAVQWHPRETSKVITGDLNGVLKYWD
ncbi:WD40 repeat-like protein [Melanomma pulvis-pyrius CBS 109.77]|uniref:WD40 repeat-like protein n=1 Tax=Melanomma pulvis-pyrius CBS 109.77 TaxID=1314802 RepID=A0A6A6XDY3_9PLEO|nr:WD40 repeat-like protein [Melanomma pulvis-pyrius CBS 109.77]